MFSGFIFGNQTFLKFCNTKHKTSDFFLILLKVPKCEIFDCSDFHYFYTIKPFWVGDFGAKI